MSRKNPFEVGVRINTGRTWGFRGCRGRSAAVQPEGRCARRASAPVETLRKDSSRSRGGRRARRWERLRLWLEPRFRFWGIWWSWGHRWLIRRKSSSFLKHFSYIFSIFSVQVSFLKVVASGPAKRDLTRRNFIFSCFRWRIPTDMYIFHNCSHQT